MGDLGGSDGGGEMGGEGKVEYPAAVRQVIEGVRRRRAEEVRLQEARDGETRRPGRGDPDSASGNGGSGAAPAG